MSEVVLAAPAKINLFLHVLDREASGYHAIETLFAALGLHDTIRVRRSDSPGVELRVEGPHDLGPPARNLAARAAEAYLERVAADGTGGVEVVLEKTIPPGAGLGGGSSDAAAVLRALDRIHERSVGPRTLLDIAARLGSDVPFFLAPTPLALAWNRGDRLLSLPPLPERPVVLVLPDFRISTADAYDDLDRARDSGPYGAGVPRGRWGRLFEHRDLSSWKRVAQVAHNDFHRVAADGRPAVDALREALEAEGARPCLLSGSGSALFGVFGDPEAAAAAARRLEETFGDVDVRVSRTLSRWPAPCSG